LGCAYKVTSIFEFGSKKIRGVHTLYQQGRGIILSKMKIEKRLLAMLLTLTMVFGLMPISVSAEYGVGYTECTAYVTNDEFYIESGNESEHYEEEAYEPEMTYTEDEYTTEDEEDDQQTEVSIMPLGD